MINYKDLDTKNTKASYQKKKVEQLPEFLYILSYRQKQRFW